MTGLEAAIAILGNTIIGLEQQLERAQQEAAMWRERFEASIAANPAETPVSVPAP